MIIKMMRKIGKLIRGGVAPRQIFLGALLGVLIGMIPGMNLSLVIGIFLLFILNTHVGVALVGVALGKLLSLLLAPLTFQIGYALLHRLGLGGAFRAVGDTPVLALLDLHKYCLVGGLPLALFIGGAFGWGMVKAVKGLRMGILEATGRSEKAQKLARNPLVRIFMRIVFGRQRGDLADMLQKKPPLFRKGGLILAGIVVVITLGLEFLLLDMVLKTGITAGISAATGAEVNLADAHLSLLGGKLELKGLQVTNPEKPTHNLFQAEHLLADVSMTDLLARRFVIDTLAVSELRTEVQRSSPGEVFEKRRKEAEEPERVEEPEDAVVRYFEKAQTLRKYLGKVKKFLEESKAKKEEEVTAEEKEEAKEKLLDLAANQGYFALSAKDILAKHPTWVIRKLSVDRVTLKEGKPAHRFQGSELSSHPGLHPRPMTLSLLPSGGDLPTVAVEFHFEKPGEMHTLQLNLKDIPLGDTIKLSRDAPLDVEDGRVTVYAAGNFSTEGLLMPFVLSIKNLRARSREGRGLLGLDPQTAGQVFQNLEELEVSGMLEGRLLSPRVKLDKEQIMASLKDTLVKAGKRELANRARQELEKVTGEVSEKVRKEMERVLPEDLGGELKKLIPGLGDEKEDEEEEEEKPRKPMDFLKELF